MRQVHFWHASHAFYRHQPERASHKVDRLGVNRYRRHYHGVETPRRVETGVSIVTGINAETVDAGNQVHINAVSVEQHHTAITGTLRHRRALENLNVRDCDAREGDRSTSAAIVRIKVKRDYGVEWDVAPVNHADLTRTPCLSNPPRSNLPPTS